MSETFRTISENNTLDKSKVINFTFNGDSFQGYELSLIHI